MQADNYLQRFSNIKNYQDKSSLLDDLTKQDTKLRQLFSQQRESWVVPELTSPYQSLVPVFGNEHLFKYVDVFSEEEAIPKVFQLGKRRKKAGESAIVDQDSFKRNFEQVFCEKQLSDLNWDNVFAAGGSVMACLQPLPHHKDDCNRSRRKYMHDEAFPGSDIDLFLYGLDAEQAKKKIVEIYDSVRESNPFDIVCFRTAHSVTLVSQYPFRHIQIVLRLYSSPSEVLTGFDVDSCAVGYDGKQVWMANRCHMALVDQINRINLLRRSLTYEMRLAKYAPRGFEVAVPGLVRGRIDPMLMERAWNKVQGLGKLLLLERLKTPEARFRYKEQHRTKQMRALFSTTLAHKFNFQRLITNKWNAPRMEGFKGGAEASDYSVVFLPWGPGYDAKKCVRLMQAKEALLNNSYLNKGREYDLHPCFMGTAEKILQDCSPDDPPIPEDADQEQLKGFVRGPLTFIEDDPGRQMIGSFHPTTDTDWVAGAYISEDMEQLCIAANANDAQKVKTMLEAGVDGNLTDFAGRSALHMASLANSVEAAKVLIDAGVKISHRMPDGRNALHVCCAYGHEKIVDMLLEKNKENEKEKELDETTSLQKDTSMEVDDFVDVKDGENEMESNSSQSGSEEDKEEAENEQTKEKELDIIDINSPDWGHRMTPLQYAILFGHPQIVKKLLDTGIDATKGWIVGQDKLQQHVITPFTLVSRVFIWLPEAGEQILQLMLKHGCVATKLDLNLNSVLHTAAQKGNGKFMAAVLKYAPDVKKCLNVINTFSQTPLLTAVCQQNMECTRLLLEAGASANISAQDCDLARKRFNSIKDKKKSDYIFKYLLKITPQDIDSPLHVAVLKLLQIQDDENLGILEKAEEDAATGGKKYVDKISQHDPLEIVKILIQFGADVNYVKIESDRYHYGQQKDRKKSTILDFVLKQIQDQEKLVKMDQKQIQKALGESMEDLEQRLLIVKVTKSQGEDRPQPRVHLKVGELLQELQNKYKNSYLIPAIEAIALQDDFKYLYGLGLIQFEVQKGWGKQARLKLAKELEKYLKTKKAKTFKEINPKEAKKFEKKEKEEDYEYRNWRYNQYYNNNVLPNIVYIFQNFPSIENAWKKITQYSLLPDYNQENIYGDQDPLLLSEKQQKDSHELFESVWKHDQKNLEKLLTKEGEQTVYVAIQNNKLMTTPFMLAVLKSDKSMMDLLTKFCIQQYEPQAKHQKIGKKWAQEDEQQDVRIGNYALQYALMSGYYDQDYAATDDENDDDDVDDDDSGGYDGFGGVVEEMRAARKAELEKEQELLDADEGIAIEEVEAVDVSTTTHVLPHKFYVSDTKIPIFLLGGDTKVNYKETAEKSLTSLWQSIVRNDEQLFKQCKKKEGGGLWGPADNSFQFPPFWVPMYPLQVAMYRKDMDIIKHIMQSALSMDTVVKEQLGELKKKKEKSEEEEEEELQEEGVVKKKQLDPLSFARKVVNTSEALPLAVKLDNVQVLDYFAKILGLHNYPKMVRRIDKDMSNSIKQTKRWNKNAEIEFRLNVPASLMEQAIENKSKQVIEWILSGNCKRALEHLCANHPNIQTSCERLAQLMKEHSQLIVTKQQPLDIIDELLFLGFAENKHKNEDQKKQKRNLQGVGVDYDEDEDCESSSSIREEENLFFQLFQNEDSTDFLEWFSQKVREYGYGAVFEKGIKEHGVLLHAASFHNPKLLELLLGWGLDPLEVEKSDRGWNILATLSEDFRDSHKTEEIERCKKLFESVLNHKNVSDDQRRQLFTMKMGVHKQTLLSIFAHANITSKQKFNMLDYVMSIVPAEMFTSRDIDGSTPLHKATTDLNLVTTHKLIEKEMQVSEKGGSFKSWDVEDNIGFTPMDISMNHLCKTAGESHNFQNKRKRTRNFAHDDDDDYDDDINSDDECQPPDSEDEQRNGKSYNIYKKVKAVLSEQKMRRYPKFEEVQVSRKAAVDAVNEEEEEEDTKKQKKPEKVVQYIDCDDYTFSTIMDLSQIAAYEEI